MPITEQEARELAHEMLALEPEQIGDPRSSPFALRGILAAMLCIEHHLQQISAGLGLLLENK